MCILFSFINECKPTVQTKLSMQDQKEIKSLLTNYIRDVASHMHEFEDLEKKYYVRNEQPWYNPGGEKLEAYIISSFYIDESQIKYTPEQFLVKIIFTITGTITKKGVTNFKSKKVSDTIGVKRESGHWKIQMQNEYIVISKLGLKNFLHKYRDQLEIKKK